jgi:hypothetical protein
VDQGLAVFVENLRAERYLEHDVFAARAVAVGAHAVAALLRLEVLLVAVVDQGVEPVRDLDDDIAAARHCRRRAAEFDELLAAKCHAAVTAVAGADVDLGFVEKFHRVSAAATGKARLSGQIAFVRPVYAPWVGERQPIHAGYGDKGCVCNGCRTAIAF